MATEKDKGIERLEEDAENRGYEKGLRSMVNQLMYAKEHHDADHDCKPCDLVRWFGGGPKPDWVTAAEIPAQDHPSFGG